MKRLLVTGCNGFLGGAVGRAAARRGLVVLGVARSAQADADWPGAFASADLAADDLAPLIAELAPNIVFHGAGSASVAQSLENPVADLRASTTTFARLLDGVRRAGLRATVLFPSSAAVYGKPARLPVDEDAPISPISPYGFHKAMCEMLAREYRDCFGLDVRVARIFSTFGPTQRRLLVWELAQQALGPEASITLMGTGDEVRDYLPVDDLAEAALDLALLEDAPHGAVNLASGVGTSVRELAAMVARAAGTEKPVHARGVARTGDPPQWVADVSRLQRLILREPPSLEGAVRACIRAWTT